MTGTVSLRSRLRMILATALCYFCASPLTWAQQPLVEIAPERPQAPILWRPYLPVIVPPIRTADSDRLHNLIRAGKLYLSVQDAVALALENNLDLEIARYNQSSLEWRLERSRAGGALPGVPSNASQTSSVTNGQGVLGSQAAAGVTGGGNNVGRTGGNATVSQVGPVVQTFDPSLQEATTFSHRSIPLANASQSLTSVLVQDQRVYSGSFQQGLVTGGSVTVNYNNRYLKENSPTDVLNPSSAPTFSIQLQHNLLQGFGRKLNERNIEVANINLGLSDLNFRSQVVGVVVNVLNTYWGLAGAYDDVKAKEETLATAQQFFDENKQRVQLGALAPVDLPASESQISVGKQNLVNSQASLRQRELALKNLISRNVVSDQLLLAAQIVPLDHVVIPEQDDLAPVKDLVAKAYLNRSDLLSEKESMRGTVVSGLGTKNGLLPSVQVFSTLSAAGLAGVPRSVPGLGGPDSYFVGGLSDAVGQVFRRNFPTESIGVFASARIGNRQAQADYGVDQLQLRQQQLSVQKDLNQVQVDVTNAVIALRQARVRYDSSVQNRTLSQQLLDAEQQKFKLGESTSYNVVVQQRDLAAARASEISSLISYQNARTNLDQTLGLTLDANSISLQETRGGRISKESKIPDNLPPAN